MMKPIYEKRRHLGCEFCGTTFYGYYTKDGDSFNNTVSEDVSGVYFPDCAKCGEGLGVHDAKTARKIYEYHEEKDRKKRERIAKKEAQPVNVDYKLRFKNKQAYNQRIVYLAKNPDDLTKYEIMSSYFLDKVFWQKFGKGCHTVESRHFTIKKHLWNGTYMSNSGKTRMGSFTPYFEVINNQTGKVREVGTQSVLHDIELRQKFGTNRRNDPDRNWGLPK
tara:strand:- start:4672 stop:5331 length:660 start_codon:yes stop_codon:yes gene_type:complete